MAIKYRADIDGLRAIAIIPVVLYHADFKLFSGGFVGVDVFFVISGFLITGIIVSEFERSGSFSFWDFYERRLRRIVPALIVMIAVTAGVASILLLPLALQDFGKSVMAATLFVANLFFWHSAGYFSAAADKMPLLHTWSLAVEEQFYILFPPFLILTRQYWPKAVLPLITIGSVASFMSNAYFASRYPQYTFFLSSFRAWEISVGALIALGAFPTIKNILIRNGLATLGLGVIFYSALGFSTVQLFPGVPAFLPCLGAALFIHTGCSGPVLMGALLSARLPVAIGRISYSLYLWHWPVFVFVKYVSTSALTFATNIILIAVSVGLAVLSWKYLETPFRRRVLLPKRSQLFKGSVYAAAALLFCGAFFDLDQGLPWRVPAEVLALDKASHDKNFDVLDCHDRMERDIRADHLCRIGDPSSKGSWMVWGDSHAWALKPAIETWMRGNGESGWISTRGGCPPLLGVVRRAWEPCREPNFATLAFIERHKIDKVLFVAAWPGYADADLKDDNSTGYSSEQTSRVLNDAVDTTFALLAKRDIKIFLFDTVPGAKTDVPGTLARAKYFNQAADIRFSMSEYKSRNEFFDKAFARNSQFITGRFSPAKVLCSTGACEVLSFDGVPLYSDASHPSSSAAPTFVAILRESYGVPARALTK